MAVSYTRCAVGVRDIAGRQLADAVAVADGAASSDLAEGIYRIAATSASLVRIGAGLSNGTGGEVWPSGTIEFRHVSAGEKIGCSAG